MVEIAVQIPEKKVKVLVVCHKPPYPKIDGGCVASAQIIGALLSEEIDFQLAMLHSPKHPYNPASFPEEIRNRIKLTHKIEPDRLSAQLLGLWSRERSIFLHRFFDSEFLSQLESLISDFRPDIIHFESLFAAVYLPFLKKKVDAKFIIRTHNIEHELWIDRLTNSSRVKQLVLNKQVKTFQKDEEEILRLASGIVCISKNEQQYIQDIDSQKSVIYLPTSIAPSNSISSFSADFFHLGAMDWEPNKRAVSWFIKQVWAEFSKNHSEKLHLAGKNLATNLYNDYSGVINHGEVLDSQIFMTDNGSLIIPLFEGSGLRIKVIEAGNLGVPIISTPKGIEGLGLEAEVHYLQANTSDEFLRQMKRLVKDVSLRERLGRSIRDFIRQNFDPNTFNRRLIEFYQTC